MTEYQPGTVAVATVRGVEGVRVMRCKIRNPRMNDKGRDEWVSMEPVDLSYWHEDHDVANVRRLVTLDLEALHGKMFAPPSIEELPAWLRTLADANRHGSDALGSQAIRHLADQIESQTKPARIPEPGLWGVVRDDMGYTWVHDSEPEWTKIGTNEQAAWDEIAHPTLIREGLS